jgi:hypothetical protein
MQITQWMMGSNDLTVNDEPMDFEGSNRESVEGIKPFEFSV